MPYAGDLIEVNVGKVHCVMEVIAVFGLYVFGLVQI